MKGKEILEKLESNRPNASAHAKAMSDNPKAQQCMAYGSQWVKQDGLKELLSSLEVPFPVSVRDAAYYEQNVKNHVTDKANHQFVAEKMQPFLKGQPPMKYVCVGAGAHGGYGAGMAGAEAGSIWKFADFGHVPMRTPYADYSVEWVTFGLPSGFDIGASVDILACSMWFVEPSLIEGFCNGVTFSGEFFSGSSVNLWWTGTFEGVNGSSHPIGISMVCSVGFEFGFGAFYNAAATQFFNKRS